VLDGLVLTSSIDVDLGTSIRRLPRLCDCEQRYERTPARKTIPSAMRRRDIGGCLLGLDSAMLGGGLCRSPLDEAGIFYFEVMVYEASSDSSDSSDMTFLWYNHIWCQL
jgi:hypothetical protein